MDEILLLRFNRKLVGFIQSKTNKRTDEYGGSKENRVRFLKEVAPGQTSASVLSYLEVLKRETVNGVTKPSKLPLCDFASKRLKEKRPNDPLFNDKHKGEEKRLEWCEDVISYYKTLIWISFIV